MKILVEPLAEQSLLDFYAQSMRLHPTLSEETVHTKIDRLAIAVKEFARYAHITHKEPFRLDWKELEYCEFIYEDIHIAYKIERLVSGEEIMHIYDAVHSLLNHN
ncbi:MAG: hypothetical protein MJZ64_03855 [Paludibacteraceae bacterium]|nr:hypothetical protein [Paludibacteraceae bacterium]